LLWLNLKPLTLRRYKKHRLNLQFRLRENSTYKHTAFSGGLPCLTMPPDEVEQISRFKNLNEEQKAMLLSATKLPRCYTEGVVLAKRVEALFRAVPPSLYLALGMTEKEEKVERQQLMNEHGCSELEAVFLVAKKRDKARGIMTEAEAA
ncbi:hypothetical protein WCT67_19185, partial [Pectobacterium parvum]